MVFGAKFAVAVHVAVCIAKESDPKTQSWVSSDFIASSVGTNPVVIRRVLSQLGKAKLVVAQSGKNGGASLARPANKITLQDIFKAVEGRSFLALNPKAPNPKCPVSRKMRSLLTPVFEEVDREALGALGKVRLSNLVDQVS